MLNGLTWVDICTILVTDVAQLMLPKRREKGNATSTSYYETRYY